MRLVFTTRELKKIILNQMTCPDNTIPEEQEASAGALTTTITIVTPTTVVNTLTHSGS